MPSFFCSRLKAGHLWRTSPLCGSGIRKNAPFPGKRRENRPDLSPLPTSPSTLGITCRVCRKGPFRVRSRSPHSVERGILPPGSLRHPATTRSAPLSLCPAPSERENHPSVPWLGRLPCEKRSIPRLPWKHPSAATTRRPWQQAPAPPEALPVRRQCTSVPLSQSAPTPCPAVAGEVSATAKTPSSPPGVESFAAPPDTTAAKTANFPGNRPNFSPSPTKLSPMLKSCPAVRRAE